MRHDINVVLEAALIRASQWRHIANGRDVMNDDVVDELFDCAPEEAASIAEEQEAAVARVRASLPPSGSLYDIDTLALAAMCLWEHAGDVHRRFGRHSEEDEPLMSWLANGEGAWAARQGCWRLAGFAEKAWESVCRDGEAPKGFDAYDWDFIPAWLEQLHTYCVQAGLRIDDVDEETAIAVALSVTANAPEERIV